MEKRKKEHIEHALNNYTEGSGNGLNAIRLKYFALPEMNYFETNCSTTFLGKTLKLPLMITAITGGWQEGKKINEDLARACQQKGIALGLGSKRIVFENPKLAETFNVRDVAPDIFLAGNIGAIQLKEFGAERIAELTDIIEADAMCVHLNPLQEAIQPEGDKDWTNCLNAIRDLCSQMKKPVIIKEVGAGVNNVVAKELVEAGVNAIDVAGVGGTSFAAIEAMRGGSHAFNDYGLTTVESLQECSEVNLPLIASGGIRNGLHIAKTIALGASLAGAARPFLKAQQEGKTKAVVKVINEWEHELRTTMFVTRSKTLKELKGKIR